MLNVAIAEHETAGSVGHDSRTKPMPHAAVSNRNIPVPNEEPGAGVRIHIKKFERLSVEPRDKSRARLQIRSRGRLTGRRANGGQCGHAAQEFTTVHSAFGMCLAECLMVKNTPVTGVSVGDVEVAPQR